MFLGKTILCNFKIYMNDWFHYRDVLKLNKLPHPRREVCIFWGGVCKVIFMSNLTSVEIVLCCHWGCDNRTPFELCSKPMLRLPTILSSAYLLWLELRSRLSCVGGLMDQMGIRITQLSSLY